LPKNSVDLLTTAAVREDSLPPDVRPPYIGEVNNFVTVLLQIHSGIYAPKVIKIEHDMTQLLRK